MLHPRTLAAFFFLSNITVQNAKSASATNAEPKVLRALPRNIICLFEFLSNRRVKVVVKVRLEFKLLSTTKTAGDHLLTLNLKNVGSSILKNLVVRLHTPDPKFSVDCAECFIYALMPSADENVKFRVSVSSLARAYFSVCGYASGDEYFSIESPVMAVQTKDSMENSMLLM